MPLRKSVAAAEGLSDPEGSAAEADADTGSGRTATGVKAGTGGSAPTASSDPLVIDVARCRQVDGRLRHRARTSSASVIGSKGLAITPIAPSAG